MGDFKEKRGYDYEKAEDAKSVAQSIIDCGMYPWVKLEKCAFIRSGKKKKFKKNGDEKKASKPRNFLARIHTFGQVWKSVFPADSPTFLIEIAAENFDKLTIAEKERVMLHELYHIVESGEEGKLRCHNEFHNINELVADFNKRRSPPADKPDILEESEEDKDICEGDDVDG